MFALKRVLSNNRTITTVLKNYRFARACFATTNSGDEDLFAQNSVFSKYVNYQDIRKSSEKSFFKSVGLPENVEDLDENSIFDFLEEHDPSVNQVVLKTIFAFGHQKGNEDKLRLGIQYWQKYCEQAIPSVHEYNQYIMLLGAANLSKEAWNTFVGMDRDCDRNACSYINFLMYHPFASLPEEHKKTLLSSFEADRAQEKKLEKLEDEVDTEISQEEDNFKDLVPEEEQKEEDEEEAEEEDEDDKEDAAVADSDESYDEWDFVKEEMISGEYHKSLTPENSLRLIRESPFFQSLSAEEKSSYEETLDSIEFPNYS